MEFAVPANVSSKNLILSTESSNKSGYFLDDYSCQPFKDDTPVIKGFKISSYCVIMLCSLLGNSFLVAIVRRNTRMQTLTNYMIVNVAVSDLLVTVLAVPRQISEIMLGPRRWLVDGLAGSILCKSVFFFQDISTAVSILGLVVITIDRYRGIVHPFRPPVFKRKFYKIVIPLIWIVPMGIHGPYFYTFRISTFDHKTYCTFSWEPNLDARKAQEIYYLIIFALLIALPASVVTVLYAVTILALRRGNTRCAVSTNARKSRRFQEDSKVVRNILAILIGFLFCVIPINVYAILFYFVWKWRMPCSMENYGFAAHQILYLNAALSPSIYLTFNDKYRRGLRGILRIIFDRLKKRPYWTSVNQSSGPQGEKKSYAKKTEMEPVQFMELKTISTA